MHVKRNNFDSLPFSKLFRDYTLGKEPILSFFETNPTDRDSVIKSLDSFQFKGHRSACVSLLNHFNKSYLNSDVTQQQIEKLSDDQSLCVVTGQQVTLFGGPLYTIYKTLTAIIYARQLQEHTGRPVIPVFWLADEDHDIEEISSIYLPDMADSAEISYSFQEYDNAPPAAGIEISDQITQLKRLLKEQLFETDFTPDLLTQIERSYETGRTFGQAFGDLLMSLFGNHGLILAGSCNPDAKDQLKDIFIESVNSQDELANVLDNTTYNLKESGYHDQVQVQPSNLFYINESGERIKLQFNDGTWSIPDKKWSPAELVDEIDSNPGKFSPNVFLRPVCQDKLLPVAAYVGGPGEVAYYAQMKQFYSVFDYRMPVILPRFSLTIMESAIDRILEKLPFEWQTYLERIEDLEKEFVESTESVDIEKIFGIWRSQIDELSKSKRNEIGEIDPSLKGSVGKAKAVYFSELDKLKGKVYRSVKDQEKVQLDRIQRIKENLFPNGNLQEREVAFIYFMNKYGVDVWDKLLEELSDEEPFEHLTLHF